MNTPIFWLILIAAIVLAGFIFRKWRHRRSDVPVPTIAWWAFQTLEYLVDEARESELEFVSIYQTLDPYMKGRWKIREREAIFDFMLREGWVRRKKEQGSDYWRYVKIEPTGKRELETAYALESMAAATPATRTGKSVGERELLSQMALALDLDGRSTAQPEIRARAEEISHEIESSVSSGSREKADFDKIITKVKDLTQIASNLNSTLPMVHHILTMILK